MKLLLNWLKNQLLNKYITNEEYVVIKNKMQENKENKNAVEVMKKLITIYDYKNKNEFLVKKMLEKSSILQIKGDE